MALGNLGVSGVTAGDSLPVAIETPAGDTAMDDTNDAVRVNIVAGSASGTEYTEGAVDASITGTALIFEGAADTLVAATGDATNGLDVDVTRLPALVAGTANIGDVDVLTIAAGDNNIGNVDVVTLPALVAGTANIGDVDVLTVPAPLSTTGGGTEATALRVTLASDSTGLVSVDDNAGSLTVDGTGLGVVGNAAHDAAASGNPVLIAGIGETMADSAPGNRASTDADAVRVATDLDGAVYAHPHGPQVWSYHENSSNALTDASVHAAPAAGLSLYVTDIVLSTGAATALNVFFEEGASTVLGPYYLEAVAGRGLALHFQTPKKITAATALTVTTSAAIAHGIDVTGYTAPG